MSAELSEDPYAILGVPRTASAAEIKAQYRPLAKASHPDIDARPEAMARMVRINQTYQLLADPPPPARGGGPNPPPRTTAPSSPPRLGISFSSPPPSPDSPARGDIISLLRSQLSAPISQLIPYSVRSHQATVTSTARRACPSSG